MARDQHRERPHRIKHQENQAFLPVDLRTLEKGDVFVRNGTPHMCVSPPAEVAQASAGQVWIVNLQSGGCWPVSGSEQVHPAIDVTLTFASTRREW